MGTSNQLDDSSSSKETTPLLLRLAKQQQQQLQQQQQQQQQQQRLEEDEGEKQKEEYRQYSYSLGSSTNTALTTTTTNNHNNNWRYHVYNFLEAKTRNGQLYEYFMITLIMINVIAFIVGTLFVSQYTRTSSTTNPNDRNDNDVLSSICGYWCDTLWFGNYSNNGLQFLQIGSTSLLEIITVLIFSCEYIVRLWVADLESPIYQGWIGRLYYIPTFFSMVDLVSTIPFYIDAFVLRQSDIATSSFLRMFRLLRMMRVEGRYDTAFFMIDDVYETQKGILFTATFVGITTWITISALFYIAERRNLQMIYCPTCPSIDTSLCTIDSWGIVNCTQAAIIIMNQSSTSSLCSISQIHQCYNMYESIPSASYYTLLNLFGEFPLLDGHTTFGKWVGTLTAVIAVAVFALPAGIIGNGFEMVITKRRKQMQQKRQQEEQDQVGSNKKENEETEDDEMDTNKSNKIIEHGMITYGYIAPTTSGYIGQIYNLVHGYGTNQISSILFDHCMNIWVMIIVFCFMFDTYNGLTEQQHNIIDSIEIIGMMIFTMEYILRIYSVRQDPNFAYPGGRLTYMKTFLSIVDLVSFVPYWIKVIVSGGQFYTSYTNSLSTGILCMKSLRLLRIFRFERYTHAFLSFDDVIRENADVLTLTAFTAILIWILFSSLLYLTERNSMNPDMAMNYNTVPNAMWITLLNLSGESPLCQYSIAGKVATGILGIFATGLFGIPIGVLGAGFQDVVVDENEDNTRELATPPPERIVNRGHQRVGTYWEQQVFDFVNGEGSSLAVIFEGTIYGLIFLAVSVGIWQTVDGHENDFHQIEWIAVVFFTLEYLLRFIGAGANPEIAIGRGLITSRICFVFSFYSLIDLLAIVPFYIAIALPNSVVNQYDEFFRMFRILRLLKLDKWIPSISLIDDVIRLKFKALRVSFYAALTLWILFAAALFVCEHKDYRNSIDPVPAYGCNDDCSMSDRFQDFFDSMVYTGIHLTGDYPIITYSWPAKIINFFMVIAAVGVVSIPSGLIASGFVEVVQNKSQLNRDDNPAKAGDDWYEIRHRELEGIDPPSSSWGPIVDSWQHSANDFLNGRKTESGHHVWTRNAYLGRVFMFTIIIANVIAVLLETIPSIDKAVGNAPGNIFDRFEAFSVMVFAIEYLLRLFCAPKNRDALYSPFVYATTFFGIVDLLSTAPWFVEQFLIKSGRLDESGDNAKIFRIFRFFRVLQLEDFVTAFSKLDNVVRASKDVLKATGLMALIVWVGSGALFFIFEENNSNWRTCDSSVPVSTLDPSFPGCYDFPSTAKCNAVYPGLCQQSAFTDMPNTLYYTAVFLVGEWGVVDFTWPGRLVCLFLCVVGIGLYAIPIGTLFDSFGAVLGLAEAG